MVEKFKSLTKGKKIALISTAVAVLLIAIGLIVYFATGETGVEVAMTTAETGDIEQKYSAAGTLMSGNDKQFKVPSGTLVANVYVKEGDVVKKGDRLADFDTSTLQANVAEKQKAYSEALSSHNEAKQAGVTASQQLIITENAGKVLDGEIANLQKQLRSYVPNVQATPSFDLEKELAGLENKTPEELQKLLDDLVKELTKSTENLEKQLQEMIGLVSKLMNKSTEKMQLQVQSGLLKAQSGISVEEITQMFVDYSKTQRDVAQASLAELSAGWVAPNDGLITQVRVVAGETVGGKSAGSDELDLSAIMGAMSGEGDITSLLSGLMGGGTSTGLVLSDPTAYYIELVIGKNDIADIKMGQKATVRVTTTEMMGEVSYISPTASGGSSSSGGLDLGSLTGGLTGSTTGVAVHVKVLNPDTTAILGFDASVEIKTGIKENIIIIPVEAISMGKVNTVLVYDKETGTVKKREVVIGSLDISNAEITKGLKKGETIVRNLSSNEFEEGARVIPKVNTDETTTK